jgi:hypothetical protein
MATATARLASTTGVGSKRISPAPGSAICRQPARAARAAAGLSSSGAPDRGAATGRLRALADEDGLVLGHECEYPEYQLAVRGGGVDDPVGQRLDPDAARVQGGDDVDQVAQVAAEPVDLPDDQGVAGAQAGQACVPVRPVGPGACRACRAGNFRSYRVPEFV